MTAAGPSAFPSPPLRVSLTRSASAQDARTLRCALALALTAHVAAFFLPLPSMPTIPTPEPERDLPGIVRATLPPPPLERTPRTVATPRKRKLPVPLTVASRPLLDPVDEPVDLPAIEDNSAPVVPDLIDGEPPLPAGPLPEWTDDLVLPVRLPGYAVPAYPPIARKVGLGGRVVLQAIVDEEGRVTSVEVVSAPETDLGFSDSAVNAVSQWLYRSGSYRGRPVAVRLNVIVEFSLE